MRMETASVVLRDFAAKDAESLCRIVREPEDVYKRQVQACTPDLNLGYKMGTKGAILSVESDFESKKLSLIHIYFPEKIVGCGDTYAPDIRANDFVIQGFISLDLIRFQIVAQILLT